MKPAAVLAGAAVLVTLGLAIRLSSIEDTASCESDNRVRYAAFIDAAARADLPPAPCVEIVSARSVEQLEQELAKNDIDGVLLDSASLYAVSASELAA